MSAGGIPCSVQVLVRNAGPGFGGLLASLRDFGEVVVLDGGSMDGSRETASAYPNVTLVDQAPEFLENDGRIADFAGVRNQGLRASTHEWILAIDSDERIDPAQVTEVRALVERGEPGVFTVFRRYVVDGEPVAWASTYPSLQVRLFHRSLVVGYVKPVHERLDLRPGVIVRRLREELLVPLAPPAELLPKYRRYVAMEAKRGANMSFGAWTRWMFFRNLRSAVGLLARLAWIWLVPRKGKRLPLAYEWQFLWYLHAVAAATFPWRRR